MRLSKCVLAAAVLIAGVLWAAPAGADWQTVLDECLYAKNADGTWTYTVQECYDKADSSVSNGDVTSNALVTPVIYWAGHKTTTSGADQDGNAAVVDGDPLDAEEANQANCNMGVATCDLSNLTVPDWLKAAHPELYGD